MLSVRGSVIALVASAAVVGVLVGVTAAQFSARSQDPPLGQALPVDQQVSAQRHNPAAPPLIAPPIVAPQPNLVDPPVVAPPVAAAPDAAAQPNPEPSLAPPQPVAVSPATPAHQEPVIRPVTDRPAPVRAQPVAVTRPPAPEAPVRDHQSASPPPSSALSERSSRSHTVDTEPCACDGQMRQVHTHWDPPQS